MHRFQHALLPGPRRIKRKGTIDNDGFDIKLKDNDDDSFDRGDYRDQYFGVVKYCKDHVNDYFNGLVSMDNDTIENYIESYRGISSWVLSLLLNKSCEDRPVKLFRK